MRLLATISLGLCLFVTALSPLFSYNEGETVFPQSKDPLTVRSITITGLEKTRRSAILPLISIRLGDPLRKEDVEQSQQRLKQTNLFSKIQFHYNQEGPEVDIELVVEEKLSVVAIPVVASNGDSLMFGATLFEANFLGLRRQFIGAAFYTLNESLNATIGYIDPSLSDGTSTLVLFAGGGKTEREDLLQDKTSIRSFTSQGFRINGGLETRTDARLQPGVQVKYDSTFVEDGDVDSAQMIGIGLSLSWKDLYYLEFFEKGLWANVSFDVGYDFYENGSPLFTETELNIAYTLPFAGKHLLKFEARGGDSTAPTALLNTLNGDGFRVLPSGDSVGWQYMAGSVTAEFSLLSFPWGTGTMAFFFDGGTYTPQERNHYTRFYGPGGGIRLYLNKIVFPALQFNIGWNIPEDVSFFSFSIGMGR
jgi:hypothetical protein